MADSGVSMYRAKQGRRMTGQSLLLLFGLTFHHRRYLSAAPIQAGVEPSLCAVKLPRACHKRHAESAAWTPSSDLEYSNGTFLRLRCEKTPGDGAPVCHNGNKVRCERCVCRLHPHVFALNSAVPIKDVFGDETPHFYRFSRY